ncbi:MAG: hypothetical protein SFU83_19755 [Meiothermus sp.]|nr:hypothetical protein [Meiothermus sp.]
MAGVVLGLLPAKWEVRVMAANLPGKAFWRGVIGEHTRGRFTEVQMQNEDWNGPVFSFDNRSKE